MPDKIVTATRIVDVSAEQYAEAHRILGSLIKQQSRLLSDAVSGLTSSFEPADRRSFHCSSIKECS